MEPSMVPSEKSEYNVFCPSSVFLDYGIASGKKGDKAKRVKSAGYAA